MAVAAHYRKKLEKDDLKRLSKEVAKKLVRGDFKSGRVKDPAAKISSKHEKTIKTYVKDFLDKAVKKKEEREKGRAARGDAVPDDNDVTPDTPQIDLGNTPRATAANDVSPDDSSSELKRKREIETGDSPRNMRSRIDEPPAAPPPPPPPTSDMRMDVEGADLTPMDDGSLSCPGTAHLPPASYRYEQANGQAQRSWQPRLPMVQASIKEMAVVIYIRCWVDIGVLASSLHRYGSLIIKQSLIYARPL